MLSKALKAISYIIFIIILIFANTAFCNSPQKQIINYPLSNFKLRGISLSFFQKNIQRGPHDPNMHNGIDVDAHSKEDVFSLCDGILVHDNTSRDYGHSQKNYWNSFIVIQHSCAGNNFFAYYGHVLNRIKDPKRIKVGEKIAEIRHDETGEISDHLHLSISTGIEWNRSGWGYNRKYEDVKAERYEDPLIYLTFADTASLKPPPNAHTLYPGSSIRFIDVKDPKINFQNNAWTELKLGEQKDNFSFSIDGTLFYRQNKLASKIYAGSFFSSKGTELFAADTVIITPASPSKNHILLFAIYEHYPQVAYILDWEKRTLRSTYAGKYMPKQFIYWSPDEQHATLTYCYDNACGFSRIDLDTGEALVWWPEK